MIVKCICYWSHFTSENRCWSAEYSWSRVENKNEWKGESRQEKPIYRSKTSGRLDNAFESADRLQCKSRATLKMDQCCTRCTKISKHNWCVDIALTLKTLLHIKTALKTWSIRYRTPICDHQFCPKTRKLWINVQGIVMFSFIDLRLQL